MNSSPMELVFHLYQFAMLLAIGCIPFVVIMLMLRVMTKSARKTFDSYRR